MILTGPPESQADYLAFSDFWIRISPEVESLARFDREFFAELQARGRAGGRSIDEVISRARNECGENDPALAI